MNLIHLQEAVCMFKRYFSVKKQGFKKYTGTPEQICRQIIEECWNGTFFQVSTGHFKAFYVRDFAYCVDGLLALGYNERVRKTLHYALHCFARNKRITTTLVHDTPIDMFHYAPDSLPLLLRSLHVAKAFDIIETYKPFLEQEIQKYIRMVIDPRTGLVKHQKFSSIKDHAYRRSSCYDTSMVGLLAQELQQLRLSPLLEQWNYPHILKKEYWRGNYFKDTLNSEYIAGDANVFPYWCRVIQDKKMIRQSIAALRQERLDTPFPLKYTKDLVGKRYFPFGLIAPNYEGNTIWLHLGLCYIDIVQQVNPQLARIYLEQYTQIINEYKTFPEVLHPWGKLYTSWGYYCDEGMLWSSYYLFLMQKSNKSRVINKQAID